MRTKMAVEGENQVELQAHEKSYSLFASMMKWGTILSFVVAAIVVLLIAN